MDINYLAVAVAAVAQFAVGAVWYMPIFGSLWGKIHGFQDLTKAQQKEAQKQMMPMLVVQFVGTLLTTVILAKLIATTAIYAPYSLALLIWAGFFVPTQVAAVIFGGTDTKWVVKKIAIMAGGSLACLLVATAVLQAF